MKLVKLTLMASFDELENLLFNYNEPKIKIKKHWNSPVFFGYLTISSESVASIVKVEFGFNSSDKIFLATAVSTVS